MICGKRGEIHGIVSWGGPECASKDRPGVYSHVGHFRYWIDEQVQKVQIYILRYSKYHVIICCS